MSGFGRPRRGWAGLREGRLAAGWVDRGGDLSDLGRDGHAKARGEDKAMDLVLFDVDGTLVDSQNIIFEGMRRAFDGAGQPVPSRQAVLGIIGMSLPVAMAGLAGVAETDALIVALVDGYKAAFQDLRRMAARYEALYPGAKETLLALAARQNTLLGVATGKSLRGVAAVVEAYGFDGLFATVQTADTHPSKPHPSMIVTALTETGVAAERCVMVGDSSYDMEMARAAGVFALGVSWGYQPVETLLAAGAHAVVDRFEDVEPAIARLLNW